MMEDEDYDNKPCCVLYGLVDEGIECMPSRRFIALFDTEEMAAKYEFSSRLAKYRTDRGTKDQYVNYLQRSLLLGCCWFEIEEFVPVINPKI